MACTGRTVKEKGVQITFHLRSNHSPGTDPPQAQQQPEGCRGFSEMQSPGMCAEHTVLKNQSQKPQYCVAVSFCKGRALRTWQSSLPWNTLPVKQQSKSGQTPPSLCWPQLWSEKLWSIAEDLLGKKCLLICVSLKETREIRWLKTSFHPPEEQQLLLVMHGELSGVRVPPCWCLMEWYVLKKSPGGGWA